MSGFEVAGIVLGSFPIIVGALELYVKGASAIQKWRLFKRRLNSLLNSIETEQVKLKNVYEKLLWGITPPTQIEEMIDAPFGPLWKNNDIYNNIRRRLQRSLKVFERTVGDLRDITEELKQKLGIQSNGKVNWAENTNVKREFKRIAFILKTSEYEELLSRMRDGVSALEQLLSLDLEMEPNRRRVSQARLYTLIRNVSTSLYHAVRLAVACGCPNMHDVGLKLIPPSSTSTTEDKDEDIIKHLHFYILVSHDSTILNIDGAACSRVKRWSELLIRPMVTRSQTGEGADSTQNSFTPTKNNSKGVRFSLSTNKSTPENHIASTSTSTTTSVITQTLATALVPLDMLQPEDIRDLCKMLPKLPKQESTRCCGYISDSSNAQIIRRYSIYPGDGLSDNGDRSVTSLSKILADVSDSAPTLLYGDRLRLAWTIASSSVQLQSTPWISSMLTLDEIFLIQRSNKPVYQDVIVIKRLPEPTLPAQASQTPNRPTLFALGILLAELILGKTIETFRPNNTQEHTVNPFEEDYEKVITLLAKVNTIAGANYGAAIRRCIQCAHNFQPNSERWDEDSHTDVLMDVVSLLEEDLKISGVSYMSS